MWVWGRQASRHAQTSALPTATPHWARISQPEGPPFGGLRQQPPTSPPGGLSADFRSGPAKRGKDGESQAPVPHSSVSGVHRPSAPPAPGQRSHLREPHLPAGVRVGSAELSGAVEGSGLTVCGERRARAKLWSPGPGPASHPLPWPQPRHSLAVTPGLVLPPLSGSPGKAGSRAVRSSSTPGPTRRSFRPSTTGKGGGKRGRPMEPCREPQGAFHPRPTQPSGTPGTPLIPPCTGQRSLKGTKRAAQMYAGQGVRPTATRTCLLPSLPHTGCPREFRDSGAMPWSSPSGWRWTPPQGSLTLTDGILQQPLSAGALQGLGAEKAPG